MLGSLDIRAWDQASRTVLYGNPREARVRKRNKTAKPNINGVGPIMTSQETKLRTWSYWTPPERLVETADSQKFPSNGAVLWEGKYLPAPACFLFPTGPKFIPWWPNFPHTFGVYCLAPSAADGKARSHTLQSDASLSPKVVGVSPTWLWMVEWYSPAELVTKETQRQAGLKAFQVVPKN